MAKLARVLEIEDNKILVGLLNDQGVCGTGACEGCSCSTKLPTMRIAVEDPKEFETGMDVEMILTQNVLADWLLLIIMPVLLVTAVILIPRFLGWQTGENTVNLSAVAAGITGFAAGAVLLKFLRRNQVIRLEKINNLP